MHGALIWPSQYQKFLQNTVAEFHFTLTHWSIGGKAGGVDTYTTDIVNILVLIHPPPTIVSPRKCKVCKGTLRLRRSLRLEGGIQSI